MAIGRFFRLLAEACLFAPDLWEKTARAAAEEAAQDGVALTFAPMLDVARDPRWGSIVEGPARTPGCVADRRGQDAGFQGRDLLRRQRCRHGQAFLRLWRRDRRPRIRLGRHIREKAARNLSAAVLGGRRGGTAAIMPAFIDIAGVPMTANAGLLQGWLSGVVGFEGVMISDYNAVAELLNHGVAADLVEAAALALKAGVDIDMTSGAYARACPRRSIAVS